MQDQREQLERKVRDYIERVWNQKQLHALDELASPGYRRHLGPTHPSLDRAAQKQRLQGLQAALPDVHFAIELLRSMYPTRSP